MKKTIITIITISTIVLLSCSHRNLAKEAEKNFYAMVEAYRSDNYELALSFLSEKMRIQIDPANQAEAMKTIDFKVISSEEYNGAVRLLVEMRLQRDTTFSQNTRIYFIKQKKQLLMTIPADVITKDWTITETPNFIIYAPVKPEDSIINILETAFSEAIDLLEIKPKEKINYYFCRTREEVGEVLGSPKPVGGLTTPGNIACLQPSRHEVFHAVSFAQQTPIIFLMEGMASWFSYPDSYTAQINLTAMMQKLLESGNFVSLESLLDFRNFKSYSEDVANLEAASFVDYLINQCGISKICSLYRQARTPDDFRNALKVLYGKSLAELESLWLKKIQRDVNRK